MAIDERPGTRKGGKSKLMWIVGFVLLAIVVIIAIRAFIHGTDVPTAQNADQPGYTDADRAVAGVKLENEASE